jgi:hypothetical protein
MPDRAYKGRFYWSAEQPICDIPIGVANFEPNRRFGEARDPIRWPTQRQWYTTLPAIGGIARFPIVAMATNKLLLATPCAAAYSASRSK